MLLLLCIACTGMSWYIPSSQRTTISLPSSSYTTMAAAEELLFERLCKVDPTIPDTLLNYRHQMDIEDYDRFGYVLMTEKCSHYELREAIFRVFDAKLIEFGLDPGKAEKHGAICLFLPVFSSVFSIKEGSTNCYSSLSATMESWWSPNCSMPNVTTVCTSLIYLSLD